jgi:hypothetical protein
VQTVFILDYQLQVELVGPVHIGDRVSWAADTQVDDFYGDADTALREARYFAGDEALSVDGDELAAMVVAGEVTEILAVWCRHERLGRNSVQVPGTVRTALRTEANRWQQKETPDPDLNFEGYLISVE